MSAIWKGVGGEWSEERLKERWRIIILWKPQNSRLKWRFFHTFDDTKNVLKKTNEMKMVLPKINSFPCFTSVWRFFLDVIWLNLLRHFCSHSPRFILHQIPIVRYCKYSTEKCMKLYLWFRIRWVNQRDFHASHLRRRRGLRWFTSNP